MRRGDCPEYGPWDLRSNDAAVPIPFHVLLLIIGDFHVFDDAFRPFDAGEITQCTAPSPGAKGGTFYWSVFCLFSFGALLREQVLAHRT